MMTRKSQVIDALELSLLSRVDNFLKEPGRFNSSPELDLLAFSFQNGFKLHAIILTQGILNCQDFNSLYFVWQDFQNKRFYERQNSEAFFINKCLLHKNTKYLKNTH